MSTLLVRLPPRDEIACVFGGVVFAVFSWSVRGYLYGLPSWMLYYQAGELFGILAYLMAFALLESLSVTALLALVALVLPYQWFSAGFAYKGILALLVFGAAAIRVQAYPTYMIPALHIVWLSAAAALLILVLLIRTVQALPALRRFLLVLVERLQIFTYIYVPIGLIGLVVVLVRNLR